MKAIYKFHWDCKRMGDVEGIFIEDTKIVDIHIGKNVSFGEILGKHSEIFGTLDKEDLTILTTDQDFINKFIDIIGDGTIAGYNPIEYINEQH